MNERMPMGDWLRLRWWRFLDHFHRCPECGHWPDSHRDGVAPRWEDDKTAAMLGIGRYGCRRCGHGAIEERNSQPYCRICSGPLNEVGTSACYEIHNAAVGTCPTACVETNHPGREHVDWTEREGADDVA